MKTKLLCIIFLSIPTAMAYEMRLSGPNICKQDTIYPYEAIMKRENDDKKKGNLKELKYEWFLPGFIPEKADEKTPIAKVRTPKVEAFSPDPKKWPKASAACNGKAIWSRRPVQEVKTSNRIDVTISPQQLSNIRGLAVFLWQSPILSKLLFICNGKAIPPFPEQLHQGEGIFPLAVGLLAAGKQDAHAEHVKFVISVQHPVWGMLHFLIDFKQHKQSLARFRFSGNINHGPRNAALLRPVHSGSDQLERVVVLILRHAVPDHPHAEFRDVLPFSTDKILPVHRLVAGELLPVQLPGAILSILEKAEFHVGRLFKAYQQLGAGMPLHLKHGETFRPHGLAGNHLRRRYGVMPDHQRKRLQGIPHEGGFLDHVRSAQIFLRLHQAIAQQVLPLHRGNVAGRPETVVHLVLQRGLQFPGQHLRRGANPRGGP